MNRDLPIQVKEQKQTKNKNKFHRVEDAKKILKELISYQIELMRKKKSTHTQLHTSQLKKKNSVDD